MFKVHPVDHTNRTGYQSHLETYFRLRHDIYVEERGWHELRRPDGREIDAFDTGHAVHLLGIAPQLGVVAGSRLVPTTRPHLMSEVFPSLAGGRVPRHPNVFEWTRFFVTRSFREPGRPCRAAGLVYCSIQEYCLQHDIRNLTIVCEDYWFRRLASIGWNPRLLGNSLQCDNTTIVGLMVEVSNDALRSTRQIYRISEPVLQQHGKLPAVVD